MLQITVPAGEFYDDDTEEFINVKSTKLLLEHSLLSVAKWESKWKRSFMSKGPSTIPEFMDYIRCMTIDRNVDPLVYRCLSPSNIKEIREYIDDPMTATTFNEDVLKRMHKGGPKKNRVITNEMIYYWMTSYNIPMECEKWHLNRLLTLIRVCSIENNPNKNKMSKRDIMAQNRALNDARRAKYHTKG